MRTLMVLGNCVAERLAGLLAGHEALRETWQVLPAPVIQRVRAGAESDALAARAARCDLVFSQPLFSYGACNTARLRPLLKERLVTFSAPNFEAYFPDVLNVPGAGAEERFPPPLEWHSRVIVQCRAAGLPLEEVAEVYLNHTLFRAPAVRRALERTWEKYARREQDVTLGTLDMARREYAREALFHTWNHPGESMLALLFVGMLRALGLAVTQEAALRAIRNGPWSFGFNRWPIITRHHSLFAFPGRECFHVGGKQVSIEDAAAGYYTYYDFHPHVFEAALRVMTKNTDRAAHAAG